jgi:glyoxylase-like metal-dependent hydrolase (beta-lactamase superfamily II)
MYVRHTEITPGVHVVSVWDPAPWRCFTNCYVVRDEGYVTMIDCGRDTHAAFLSEALRSLGLTPDSVVTLVATHAHADHYGGYAALSRARKLLHPADLEMLPIEVKPHFHPLDQADVPGFALVHVPWHTPGSVALFHPASGCLFAGDQLYISKHLEDELVGPGKDAREQEMGRLKSGLPTRSRELGGPTKGSSEASGAVPVHRLWRGTCRRGAGIPGSPRGRGRDRDPEPSMTVARILPRR